MLTSSFFPWTDSSDDLDIDLYDANYEPEVVYSDENGSDEDGYDENSSEELSEIEAPEEKTQKFTTRDAKEERKLRRNTGLEYQTLKGKVVKARARKPSHKCKRHKCHKTLTDEEMKTLFNEYWNQQPTDHQPSTSRG